MVDHNRPVLSKRAETLARNYEGWLVVERGLAANTVEYYVSAARLFLSGCKGRRLMSLTAGDVMQFVVREWPRFGVGTAKNLATGLRSFLGYLYLEGLTDRQLALAVPAPSAPHEGSLPRWLGAAELAALVAEDGGGTAIGLRDHAIVVMAARLGLRAAELAALTLDDLDWRAGEVVVRGKGSRTERLPLPADVGEALVGYLRRRPLTESRALFVRAVRPAVGLSAPGVSSAVGRVCARAGVTPVGAHRLRHSAATAMLRAGATMAEVGQVLRQRSSQVTTIYAKVDFLALRALAAPWPGDAA